jgi:metalloendopeptidase OMA1, mitochondrial
MSRKTRPGWIRTACAAALGSAVLLAGGCASVDFVTGQSTHNMYLLDDDVALGSSVLKQTETEMAKAGVPMNERADPVKYGQLKQMVGRIAKVSHLPALPYEVVLFKTNIVNAMAAPGGKVMVFTGLYDGKDRLVNDENEMSAVLGHEIAHVTCRHTTESLTRQAPMEMLFLAGSIYAAAKKNEDLAAGLGGAFLLYKGLWVPKYSRKDELEADRVGLMYMAKAGYDPRAAPKIWQRAMAKGGDPGVLSLLSTHPSDKARFEQLNSEMPAALAEYEKARAGPRP